MLSLQWILLFLSAVFCCLCQGEDLVISHLPSYVGLNTKAGHIRVSEVQHLLSALHGFTLHKELSFTGLSALPPFHHPKASALITLYGGAGFTSQLKEPKIHLKADSVYVSSHSLQHNLEKNYRKESNVVEISHGSKVNDFDGILEGMSDSLHSVRSSIDALFPTTLLNASDPEVFQLFRQISLVLQSLYRVAKSGAGVGDFYSFELYVPNSNRVAENEEINALLHALLNKVKSQMTSTYGDEYVVLMLSLSADNIVKSRKTRSLMATDSEENLETVDAEFATLHNVATAYSEDYPVIFHIVLWLTVFMALLVIFVTHGMMTMDPGNDSIIYRMTTTRLKKD